MNWANAQQFNLQFGAGFGAFSFIKIQATPFKENLEKLTAQIEPCISIGLNIDFEVPKNHIFRTGLSLNTFGASQVWNQKVFANLDSDTLYYRSNYSNYRLNSIVVPINFESKRTHLNYGVALLKTLGIKHNSYTDQTAVLDGQKISEKTALSGFEGNSHFLPFLRSYNVLFILGYSYPFKKFLRINIQANQGLLPIFKGNEIPWANFRSTELKASLLFYFK